ncbi:hypothetical protein M422DRAFT_57542 [Sphaerobolus stellatus SS14]|nr:hypothetical protein M422DRAFT_57542 [Sphaerobolus stellatus SS14]
MQARQRPYYGLKKLNVGQFFLPCIGIHDGLVKQIVGGSLSKHDSSTLKTNFISSNSPAYFAKLYQDNDLKGGHVINLGAGNYETAEEALAAWPGGLQIGGGITSGNAWAWLHVGAEKVILTSWLFLSGRFSREQLHQIADLVAKERPVVDIRSCQRRGDTWVVAMNKWQDLTDLEVNKSNEEIMRRLTDEFLIHATDVEGLCQGIDEELVTSTLTVGRYLGSGPVDRLSKGKVDLTSLDILCGELVKFEELVKRNKGQ